MLLQPSLAAATISFGDGCVIRLWTGISCTAGSIISSGLYFSNSAILRKGTSGACTAYCFQFASSLHALFVIVTFSKNLQFLAQRHVGGVHCVLFPVCILLACVVCDRHLLQKLAVPRAKARRGRALRTVSSLHPPCMRCL